MAQMMSFEYDFLKS